MALNSTFNKETTSDEVATAFSDVIAGKTIVITGVSPNGLGEAVVKALAPHKPTQLVFIARSLSKAEAVASQIKGINPSQNIHCFQMDLSSKESVREATTELLAKISSIDILINNAGVMAIPDRTLSVDGHEMHFAANFLGHYLLTNLLVANLAQNARVVNVTSGGYTVCPIRFHDLSWECDRPLPAEEEPNWAIAEQMGLGGFANTKPYNPMLAYLHSNTASMLFTARLQKKLQVIYAVAISAAPGVVTELQRHVGGFRNKLAEYKTASQGGASFLVAALNPWLQNHPGAFIDDCTMTEIIVDHAKNKQIAERLWDVAEKMTT